MSRASHPTRLVLWMNGVEVGYWKRVQGIDRLAYAESWLASEQRRPLSLSLPFRPGNAPYQGAIVANYFDNLLPDSDAIRRRIAQRYSARDASPFALLEAVGRDCVGALQLLQPGQEPDNLQQITGTPLSLSDIAHWLRELPRVPAPGHDASRDLRLSIAGAQEKTALLWHRDQWWRPDGSTPTTHILKLPLGLVGGIGADMRTSVENEWLCALVVAAYGLPVAPCGIGQFEDQKALVVARFDRRHAVNGRWIMRLPQEDLCQATGTSGLNKYQADGGPGIETGMDILAGSVEAEHDRRHFFTAQLVFWLLAAADGNAKNFSIAHLPGADYRATPLYDVLSFHPIIGRRAGQIAPQRIRMAMAVCGTNRHYAWHEILNRHWLAQGRRCGMPEATVLRIIERLVATTPRVIATVSALLPRDFPADLADAVFEGLRKQARKLETGL
ncbi:MULTISPECIES: type II toxin-antitoxin system HipA family toxin [unclassified Burkholderia]|uniref:type II toxin-antitoxin system HipA family toxin n=1 Tax=unclassified Burkholderia TaxID=2613784 RepID=UPI00141E69ED|nr:MULTISPECIES: type II toxin-antitoxin system HipA family toxin [unclassified Burkholderia]NIE83639.1 type II toxin-antitoxin system HipA family toxin [Burkholderia sp. Tr-860]NIF62304.1 type II toxin-antitoxin system HipA family toxin [Burkholderia sp. Cy-647]NIF95361.1 type II toxin-antitoxin system HipA family toxin [Burkholderia sp. Ax-1720]